MPPASPAAAPAKPLTVALIGNPNTGKSTLFNALCGGNARIGNFPGVTVEKKIGKLKHEGRELLLVDLPGTYSLAARSADEMVSVDVLLGRMKDVGRPDAVVCIVDASNLERNLYLYSQIRDLGVPVVLVLNMWDVAQSHGAKIDLDLLRERLAAEIVTTSAHRREGIDELKRAILAVADRPAPAATHLFPDAFQRESEQLGTWLSQHGASEVPPFLRDRMLLDVHGESEHRAAVKTSGNLSEYLGQARQRLLQAGCRIPMVETKVRYDWVRTQLDGVVAHGAARDRQTVSDRIDKILTHRVLGMAIFAALMLLVFQAIYAWSEPFMKMVEGGQGMVAELAAAALPPGILRSLLVDGIIAGVGSVIIFLPQIVLLFLFIAILEDCGYMARAAFLMDKLMTKVGLSGKSFLPMMSSFACAIPGVMATRTIENRRDRMVTMLVAPLMSCSARLPVYLVMIGAFIPPLTLLKWGATFATSDPEKVRFVGLWLTLPAVTLFAFYALGAVVAIPIAWLLKKTFFKGETPPFVMELPPYKWPSPHIVFDRVYDRAKAFVVRAGTLIFCVTVLVWAAGYFPEDHTQLHQVQAQIENLDQTLQDAGRTAELELLRERENELSAQLIRDSYLGRAGRAIEPAVRPLGWDWRLGVGAIASFPAREVIIATLGTIFSLGGDVDEDNPGLIPALSSATWPDGRPLFTIPVALSVMVFFALCAQCGATLMVIGRESNSWQWPVFTFVYMTALAYVAALATYQIGTWLGG